MTISQRQYDRHAFADDPSVRKGKCRDLAGGIELQVLFGSVFSGGHVDGLRPVRDADFLEDELDCHSSGHRFPKERVFR